MRDVMCVDGLSLNGIKLLHTRRDASQRDMPGLLTLFMESISLEYSTRPLALEAFYDTTSAQQND